MKKIIVFLLSLTIALTPTFLWAFAAEKWEVLENNYDHSSNKVKIEARKITQSAANSGRYKVEIPVNANTLGATAKRMLWAGAAVGAITALVEGVGWVIDEGSQLIKKPKPDQVPNTQYLYAADAFPNDKFPTVGEAASNLEKRAKILWPHYYEFNVTSYDQKTIYVTRKSSGGVSNTYYNVLKTVNPKYDPNLQPQYDIVSDTELGNEILGNGTQPNSRPQPSPDIITDAYSPNNPVSDAPAPQETIRALENANPEPETEPKGESETEPEIDPETGEATGKEKTTFELPNFCSWAPAVCDFFTVQKADNKDIKNNQREQIEQDKTFFEKVSEWFDWSKEEPNLDHDQVEIEEPEEFDTSIFTKDRFQVSRQCPAPEQHTITLSGVSVSFSFDMTPLCTVLEMARPALVACSYLYAAYIVIGAARNG